MNWYTYIKIDGLGLFKMFNKESTLKGHTLRESTVAAGKL